MISSSSIMLDHSSFCNSEGSIRINLVRKHLGLSLNPQKIDLIKELYIEWRDTFEALPLRLVYQDTKVYYIPDLNADTKKYCNYLESQNIHYSKYKNHVFIDGETSEWVLNKCSKRGNDVYVRNVRKKFNPLLKSDNHKSFFSTVVNDKRKRIRKTKMLYITGTCNQKITGDISNSWVSFGLYWNSFITNIREQFNNVEYVRAWQSQENGYPHFHAMVYFNDFNFTATKWLNKKGKIEWRVHNKQKLNGKFVRDRLKSAWKWGNLDIICCSNSKKSMYDLVKYITRDLEGGESDLTNAMIWYFGKQSYSFSKGFLDLFNVKQSIGEPTDAEYINAEGVIQRSNSKGILKRIEVFPCIRRDLMPSFTQPRLDNWHKIPDPPPEIVDYFIGKMNNIFVF